MVRKAEEGISKSVTSYLCCCMPPNPVHSTRLRQARSKAKQHKHDSQPLEGESGFSSLQNADDPSFSWSHPRESGSSGYSTAARRIAPPDVEMVPLSSRERVNPIAALSSLSIDRDTGSLSQKNACATAAERTAQSKSGQLKQVSHEISPPHSRSGIKSSPLSQEPPVPADVSGYPGSVIASTGQTGPRGDLRRNKSQPPISNSKAHPLPTHRLGVDSLGKTGPESGTIRKPRVPR